MIAENLRTCIDIFRTQEDSIPLKVKGSTWSLIEFVEALAVGLIVWLLRVWIHRVMFSNLFKNYSKRKRQKLSENLYYTVAYSMSFCFGISVFLLENWALDLGGPLLTSLWTPYPPPVSAFFRSFYIIEFGYYLGNLAFLLLTDTRHSDFLEFFIHHISTLLLIFISYSFQYVRIGLVILTLHDASDILLYGTKCVYYFGVQPLDSIMFCVFAIVFYITRLFIFPRIIWGVAVDVVRLVLNEPSFSGFAANWTVHFSHYFVCLIALCTLELLHCFWFSLILKMIGRVIFASFDRLREEGDIRSDDEGGDE
eukprot:jgi/Galph1/661/GphlegSOOS_G5312.1